VVLVKYRNNFTETGEFCYLLLRPEQDEVSSTWKMLVNVLQPSASAVAMAESRKSCCDMADVMRVGT
jgi:hypothetical protein